MYHLYTKTVHTVQILKKIIVYLKKGVTGVTMPGTLVKSRVSVLLLFKIKRSNKNEMYMARIH